MGANIKERIEDDFKKALKERKMEEVSFLRLIKNAILNKEIEKQRELKEDEILEILFSEIKKIEEAIILFKKGGREDLVEKAEKEKEILKRYLPPQLSDSELEKLVREKIEKLGVKGLKEMGKVIGALILEAKGRVDGKRVAEMVKKVLSE